MIEVLRFFLITLIRIFFFLQVDLYIIENLMKHVSGKVARRNTSKERYTMLVNRSNLR